MKAVHSFGVVAAVISLVSTAFAQETPFDKAEALIDAYASSDQFQGTARLDTPEIGSETISRGMANDAERRPNTEDTSFHIASISKAFTAVMVLQMADDGLISLDDPVSTWLPELKEDIGDNITVKHLLNHTSGLPRDYAEALDWDGESALTIADVATAVNASGLLYTPGEKRTYSNTGYRILAYILEAVENASYVEILQTRIVEPAGLTHTQLGPDEDSATGYDSPDTITLVPAKMDDPNKNRLLGASGIYTTAGDLSRFMGAISSGALLNDDTKTLMLTAPGAAGANGIYGMGWDMYPMDGGGRIIFSSGRSDGFLSFMTWVEDNPGTRIVLLANDTRLGQSGFSLFVGLLEHALGEPSEAAAPPAPVHTFLSTLLEKGEKAALAYADTLDMSNAPLGNASPSQAIGEPNGGVGESRRAWAPATADAGTEWLALTWPSPIQASEIFIQFTQVSESLNAVAFNGKEHALTSLDHEFLKAENGAPAVSIKLETPVTVNNVRLVLDTSKPGWPQIDAVALIDNEGTRHWAQKATASTSAFDKGSVNMSDYPTTDVLNKLARRLEENGKNKAARKVRKIIPKL